MPGAFAGYYGSDRWNYDHDHAFPFSYEELRRYYEWVEATLPVQTAPMGTKDQIFLEAARSIGLPLQTTKDITGAAFRPQENAILQPGGNAALSTDPDRLRYPDATGCTMCGSCVQGCYEPIGAPINHKAKRSTANSYIPMAVTADRWAASGKALTLVPNAYATEVHSEWGRNGRKVVTGVTWRNVESGEVFREDARVVVMAGGCIETPRLWLNSGLPNLNGWVGRGLTNHAKDLVIGVMPFETNSFMGPGSSSRADFPGRGSMQVLTFGPGFQSFAQSFSESGVRGLYDNGGGATGPWDGPAGRPLGNEMKDMLANLDRLMNIVCFTDDDVEFDNRVDLSTSFSDEHGPVPRIVASRRSLRTRSNRNFLAAKATEILRAAGAERVIRMDWAPLFLHMQSSMRMGHNALNSVLDSNAESRWVDRLFVADNSALANAVGGPNPTLTTQALATRTSEKIFTRYFGGDPWVGTESPISSIDDAVTRAM
jgi:choline dehydrogenase-like flavoprotein